MRHNNSNNRIRCPIWPLSMNPQPKELRPTAADAAAESDDSIRTAAQWILEGIERGSVDIALVDAFVRTPEEAAADLESKNGVSRRLNFSRRNRCWSFLSVARAAAVGLKTCGKPRMHLDTGEPALKLRKTAYRNRRR